MMETTDTQTSAANTNNNLNHLETALAALKQQIPPTLTTDPDYVPIRGVRHQNVEIDDFDLDQYMDEFFVKDRKVTLMLGDSGAGKSMYAQFLMHRLWQQYLVNSNKHSLPLFISLPHLKDPVNHAVEEVLESYGLNAEQITELKKSQQFIFILDAYDEIRKDKNLVVTNKLGEWNAKVVITCRTQYLFTLEHYSNYFMPYEGEKAVPWLFTEVYLKPFNQNQIEKYLQQYVQHHDTEWKDWQVYLRHIEEIPGLKKLIETPFLLKLAVEAMPEVIKLFSTESKKEEGNKQKILKMTQAKLYDVFITQWFDRQEKKLKNAKQIPENEDIKPKFWEYAKGLAKELHLKNLTQISYEPNEDLFGEEQSENPFEKYFDERNPEAHLLRTSALLQQTAKNQYAFFHSSLIDYFVTRDLYDSASQNLTEKIDQKSSIIDQSKQVLSREKKLENDLKKEIQTAAKEQTKIPESWLKDFFNQTLITKDRKKLYLLADRVEEDEAFKQHMFDLVEASKQTEKIQIAAANAITILNASDVPLWNRDFAGISIPKADLSGGIFLNNNFEGSDLSEVNLQGSRLIRTNLRNINLKGVNFGEWSAIMVKDEVSCCVFSPDGKYLAVASGNVIELYDVATRQLLRKLKGHTDTVKNLSFTVAGDMLASGGKDQTVRLWDVKSRKALRVLKGHKHYVTSLSFNRTGDRLASGSWDKTLRLWDVASGKKLKVLEGHTDPVASVSFNRTGDRLASGSWDKTLRLWDVASGKELKVLKGHTHFVASVNFTASGDKLASGGADNTVRLWDVASGKELKVLEGHTNSVESVSFNAAGDRLASGGDKTVRLWDVASGKELRVLEGHTDSVTSVAFDAKGEKLASGGVRRGRCGCGTRRARRN